MSQISDAQKQQIIDGTYVVRTWVDDWPKIPRSSLGRGGRGGRGGASLRRRDDPPPASYLTERTSLPPSLPPLTGYKRLLSEREQLASMVIDRESEAEEHRLVASTLKKSDATKRAWRLVGDVLVEGTVADVVLEVDKNYEGLKGVCENGRQQLARKGEELKAYEKKWGITIKDRDSNSKEAEGNRKEPGEKAKEKAPGGVLVK